MIRIGSPVYYPALTGKFSNPMPSPRNACVRVLSLEQYRAEVKSEYTRKAV
mgnify:CR=1 FL=1